MRLAVDAGVLATNGVLQIDRLESLLDVDALRRTNAYTEIIIILIMERWARDWSQRIAGLTRAEASRTAAIR